MILKLHTISPRPPGLGDDLARLEVTNLENVGKSRWSFWIFSLWFEEKHLSCFNLSKQIDFAGVLNLLSPFHSANCADHLECSF